MNCIKVLAPPQGGEIPEDIRSAWIGLVLPILLEFELFSRGQLRGRLFKLFDQVAVFLVDMQLAVEILTLHRPEAARWWRENREITSTKRLFFSRGCCEVVEGVPSVTAVRRSTLEVTIQEFIHAVGEAEGAESSSFWFRDREQGTGSLRALFSQEQLEELGQSALTAPAVLLLAKEVARYCSYMVSGASSEDYMRHLSEDGHNLLRVVHRVAEQSGVKMALELVDQPLSWVEILERAGAIKIVGGLVYPTDEEQLRLPMGREGG